jgi:hypothetical protein
MAFWSAMMARDDYRGRFALTAPRSQVTAGPLQLLLDGSCARELDPANTRLFATGSR